MDAKSLIWVYKRYCKHKLFMLCKAFKLEPWWCTYKDVTEDAGLQFSALDFYWDKKKKQKHLVSTEIIKNRNMAILLFLKMVPANKLWFRPITFLYSYSVLFVCEKKNKYLLELWTSLVLPLTALIIYGFRCLKLKSQLGKDCPKWMSKTFQWVRHKCPLPYGYFQFLRRRGVWLRERQCFQYDE